MARHRSRRKSRSREDAIVAFFQSPLVIVGIAALAFGYHYLKTQGKLPASFPEIPNMPKLPV